MPPRVSGNSEDRRRQIHGYAKFFVAKYYIYVNIWTVKRGRFISRLRRYARKNGLPFRLERQRGKGSHITVYVGDKRSIVKSGELKPGHVAALLKQLGLPPDAP